MCDPLSVPMCALAFTLMHKVPDPWNPPQSSIHRPLAYLHKCTVPCLRVGSTQPWLQEGTPMYIGVHFMIAFPTTLKMAFAFPIYIFLLFADLIFFFRGLVLSGCWYYWFCCRPWFLVHWAWTCPLLLLYIDLSPSTDRGRRVSSVVYIDVVGIKKNDIYEDAGAGIHVDVPNPRRTRNPPSSPPKCRPPFAPRTRSSGGSSRWTGAPAGALRTLCPAACSALCRSQTVACGMNVTSEGLVPSLRVQIQSVDDWVWKTTQIFHSDGFRDIG